MCLSLEKWDNFIIDMDGVLWRGETPLSGLQEFFTALRGTKRNFVLATNNSNRTVNQYLKKLRRMGVQVSQEEILTSAQVTANHLANTAPNGSRVSVIGGDGLRTSLQEHDFEITDENPAYVVVGFDHNLNWDKLNTAVLNIRAGAVFVATNSDATYPTEAGTGIGNGAIVAAINTSTGETPIIVGKPEPPLYKQALQRLGGSPAQTIMIGDRLETDILGANRAGITSLLLLTGVTTQDNLTDSDIQPDFVLPGLPELTNAMLSKSETTPDTVEQSL